MATPSSDVSITREQLTKYFHLPITDVAKELGICATMLKKICRKNGIPRWPHRKIKSLNKMIESLEASLPNDGSEAGECIRQEIVILKNKKSLIMRNPSILVQGSKRSAGDGDDGTPHKKQRSDSIEAPVTTFTSPKAFPPSAPNSFSINQLLTGPTTFSTPLTSAVADEKDYRSYHPHAPPPPHFGGQYPPSDRPSSYPSPLTSYLPPSSSSEEEEHARHADGRPPSPPPFPPSHPSDPYYLHKAALAYQYQYHRQFPLQHPYQNAPPPSHPGYPPQPQGSPPRGYGYQPSYMGQQLQLSSPEQQQQAQQQQQHAQQQAQQQQMQQQQQQQAKSSPQSQQKPGQPMGPGSSLPKLNLTGGATSSETSSSQPGSNTSGFKFRPPSPPLSSSRVPPPPPPSQSPDLVYYYHFQPQYPVTQSSPRQQNGGHAQ